jgi:hypothetical protein
MALIISPKVQAKLAGKQPPVTRQEIEQCFANRTGRYMEDTREEHASVPTTLWFIAETDFGRKLKIAFIPHIPDIVIRTAYDPNQTELSLYLRKTSSKPPKA